MKNRPQSRALIAIALVAACAAMLAGCQPTRRIIVTSEPAGALVHINDQQMGRTPLEVDFTYFGVYDVRLELDGYEPLWTEGVADPRFHDQPFIDLGALFVPGGVETIIEWRYVLEPDTATAQDVIDRARALRPQLDPTESPDQP